AAPGWLATAIDVSDWNTRYGRRVDSWRMPSSKTKREELAGAYALMAHGLDLASAEWFRSCFIMTRRGVCMADARLSRQVSAGF
ncbi:hypothetical protein EEB14_63045, partial [Rhodococcus sp. WS4]